METIGKRFVSSLQDTLWYLDGQHSKFAERGLALPIRLSRFDGYNDWRAKKAKQPQLSQDNLTQHINTLSDTLLSPWMIRELFKPVLEDVEKLVECMNNKTLVRAQDLRANGAWLSKLTEWNMKCLS